MLFLGVSLEYFLRTLNRYRLDRIFFLKSLCSYRFVCLISITIIEITNVIFILCCANLNWIKKLNNQQAVWSALYSLLERKIITIKDFESSENIRILNSISFSINIYFLIFLKYISWKNFTIFFSRYVFEGLTKWFSENFLSCLPQKNSNKFASYWDCLNKLFATP